MTNQILDYLILRSNNDFIFKIPHPDILETDCLDSVNGNLFNELSLLKFDHFSEVVIFKTMDCRLGFIGEQFTSWYPDKLPSLGIKMLDAVKVDGIHLQNMKPAKGPGFCTISLSPASRDFIFFFFTGNDRNWDHNFKKTDRLLMEIGQFIDCKNIKVTTDYNT